MSFFFFVAEKAFRATEWGDCYREDLRQIQSSQIPFVKYGFIVGVMGRTPRPWQDLPEQPCSPLSIPLLTGNIQSGSFTS